MIFIKPKSIRIEASSLCQLKCPCCPRSQGVIDQPYLSKPAESILNDEKDSLNPWSRHAAIVRRKPIGLGYLLFNNFKKIIDENPCIRRVELSNWGEIFLNPQLIDIMAYAYERGVQLTADNGVNLNTVNSETLEALVKYQFLSLSCSINAATNQTYRQYSVGGNLETVLDNICKINAFKKKYRSPFPLLHWQFVIFGHNEHEIIAAQKKAKELGMYFILKLNVSNEYSPVVNKEFIRSRIFGGYASRMEFFSKKRMINRQKLVCAQLWNTPQINWDGRMLGCCLNYWDDFGNVFDSGLFSVLNGERMNYARSMLSGKEPFREDILCSHCIYYKLMKNTENWLTPADIYFYKIGLWLKYECIRVFKGYPLPSKYSI